MTGTPKSIALVSGGLDSLVAAAYAVAAGPTAFLHVNYGQRTEARELRAFNDIADHYGITERLVADIGYLKEIGGSALTDTGIAVPESGGEGIPVTYVPFRNAHLLAIAVSWAEATGAEDIYIGAVEEDAPGYPDCTREFFEAFQRTVDTGTKPGTRIRVMTPLIEMNKALIVKKGIELDAPLGLTWSCYRESGPACGVCDSCVLRLRGFREAGVEDPIEYMEDNRQGNQARKGRYGD